MKNAIILHGTPGREEYYDPEAPSMSNAHWLPWLQGQLLKADIEAATPEVPRSYERIWGTWEKEFERYDLTSETILVGHSTGAGFIVKYLSVHPDLRVSKVVLVAPWLDPFKQNKTSFLDDFEIDRILAERTKGISVFYSDNDDRSIDASVEILRNKTSGIKYREFPGYGHFCIGDLKTPQFPELLEELL